MTTNENTLCGAQFWTGSFVLKPRVLKQHLKINLKFYTYLVFIACYNYEIPGHDFQLQGGSQRQEQATNLISLLPNSQQH